MWEAPKSQDITQPSNLGITVEKTLSPSNFPQGQEEQISFENSPEQSVEEPTQDGESQDVHSAAQTSIGESTFEVSNQMRYFEPIMTDDTPLNIESGSHGFMNTYIIYSYYPILGLDTLSYMTPEDVNFLESQGCFRVPIRPLLDQFVKEYFLHIHPGLPIIDEGICWEMYTNRDSHLAEYPRMSLFVFQAIVFASSCVSTSVHIGVEEAPMNID
jgi:hypothetical protein